MTEARIAVKVAPQPKQLRGWKGEAYLYRLSHPVRHGDDRTLTEFVIVSAVVALYSGPETFIFAADKDGEVLSWTELDGSYRGGLSHEIALEGAGYSVAKEGT